MEATHMNRYKVTLIDHSQGQDREDCSFDVWVKADDADEAVEKALIDERCGVYVSCVSLERSRPLCQKDVLA
jgi:hypothetical protein